LTIHNSNSPPSPLPTQRREKVVVNWGGESPSVLPLPLPSSSLPPIASIPLAPLLLSSSSPHFVRYLPSLGPPFLLPNPILLPRSSAFTQANFAPLTPFPIPIPFFYIFPSINPPFNYPSAHFQTNLWPKKPHTYISAGTHNCHASISFKLPHQNVH
jgi:hypothetical protein